MNPLPINSGYLIGSEIGGTPVGESMAADISFANGTSTLLNIEGKSKVGLELYSASGSRSGTIYFRLTNDPVNRTPKAMTLPTVTVTDSVELDDIVLLTDIPARYLEVFFDRTTGSASTKLIVTATAKE